MAVLLWLAIAVVAWAQIGYPALLFLLARLAPQRSGRPEMEPTVTVIVAAHNEETVIAKKVKEALALDYPPEKLDVIVAADGCTDGTCSMVDGLRAPRARVLELTELATLGTC